MPVTLVDPFVQFPTGFRYLRLNITGTQGGTAYCWLSEIKWKSGGTRVIPVSSSGPADYSTVADSQDDNLGTKWEISNGSYTPPYALVFDFGALVNINSYEFWSPDENSWRVPSRNPNSWTVAVSNDGSSWATVHAVSNANLDAIDLDLLGTWSF